MKGQNVRDLQRRWLAGTATLVILSGGSFGTAVGQQPDCGDRARLVVTVLDESGSIVLLGATVVLRWTDAERMPVRESTPLCQHARDTRGERD